MDWRELLFGTRRTWLFALVVLLVALAAYVVVLAVTLRASAF
jgi:hypothetical protein